jgi:hypothetical protein
MRYPPTQPVTIMPIATLTRAEPKTEPTTVGIVEKKPPFAAPLITTKSTSGVRDVETGQMASTLTALRRRARKRTFTGPMRSLANPHPNRPSAEEKLKPATSPAPVLAERPTEEA